MYLELIHRARGQAQRRPRPPGRPRIGTEAGCNADRLRAEVRGQAVPPWLVEGLVP